MSTFLKLLPLELSGIKESELIEPDHPLEKDDQVVGDMSDTTKRLFTLGRLMEKDSHQSQLDAHYCNDKAKKLELETKAEELSIKAGVVRGLMWISLRDELGLWGANVGVRPGYKVVTMPDTQDDIPPIIRRILGG